MIRDDIQHAGHLEQLSWKDHMIDMPRREIHIQKSDTMDYTETETKLLIKSPSHSRIQQSQPLLLNK